MNKRKFLVLILLGVMFCFWAGEGFCKNVVLKTMIVNPSKTKTQKATLKTYLPREVTPADITDLGDLKIDYDIDKELYYVYKDFELGPGEAVRRSIEIKDIWIVPEAEIDNYNKRAEDFVEKLKRTKHSEEAKALRDSIKVKGEKIIVDQQAAAGAMPQTHIAAYRLNLTKFNEIKDDIAKLDEMLLKVKLAAATTPLGGKFSVKTSWGLIVGVVIGLAVLSFIFFIIWHRQVNIEDFKQKTQEVKSDEKE